MYSGGLQKADNDIRNKIDKLTYRCNSYMNNKHNSFHVSMGFKCYLLLNPYLRFFSSSTGISVSLPQLTNTTG